MDPNACLKELRELAENVLNLRHFNNSEEVIADFERMGELFQTLDSWISKGGFLPAAWNKEGSK